MADEHDPKKPGRLIDMTGKTCGLLTVISKSPNESGEANWICKCSCGNIVEKPGSYLRKKTVQSCGCKTNELISRKKMEGLIGKRFGKLKVIDRISNGKVLCICDCGKTVEKTSCYLHRSKMPSCGCETKKILSKQKRRNIAGKTFGSWTAIRHAKPEEVTAKMSPVGKYWWCKCSCGAERAIRTSALTSGRSTSCAACNANMNDLSGLTFGNLSVIKRNEDAKNSWDCLCDCGRTVTLNHGQLESKERTTCGKCWKGINITPGMKVGSLTIISKNGPNLSCLCPCGKRFSAPTHQIMSGHKTTCGTHNNQVSSTDYSGFKSGSWTVLHPAPSPDSNPHCVMWLCKCDCGTIKPVKIQNIIRGLSSSCGCIKGCKWNGTVYKSKWEAYVAMTLESLNIKFEYEPQKFNVKIKGKSHGYIPDFYIEDFDIHLEIKGRQRELGMLKFEQFSLQHKAVMLKKDGVEKFCGARISVLYSIATNNGINAVKTYIDLINHDADAAKNRIAKSINNIDSRATRAS